MKIYLFVLVLLCLGLSLEPLNAQAPNPPSDTVVEAVSPTSISVSWTINSSDHDGFVVQRRTGNSGPFDREFGSDQPPYIDTEDITVGDTFCYRVRAVRAGIRSAASNVECSEVPNLPSTPTTLQGAQDGDNAIVSLTWNDVSNNELGFNIYRRDGANDFNLVGSTARNAESFEDRSATETADYVYIVRAFNAAGESGDSNEISASVSIGGVVLPINFAVESASESSIKLSWSFDTFNYQTLTIDRRISGESTWTEVAVLDEYAVDYVDENLSQNTTYCYRIQVSNENGSDTTTGDFCTMTQFGVPDPPSSILVEGRDEASISVSWESEDLVGHSYRLERNRNSGGFSVVEDALTERSHIDTSLDYAATYCYRVKVYNDLFESIYSPTDCGIVSPTEVTGLTATLNANDQSGAIDLAWDAVDPSLGVVFVINYGPDGEIPTEVVSTTNSFTLSDLADGTRYIITVQARRQRGAFEARSEGASTLLTTYMIFWPGDTNGDGIVNAADFVQLTSVDCFGKATSFSSDGSDVSWSQSDIEIDSEDPVALRCDTDRDGEVTIFDALAIIVNAGLNSTSSQDGVDHADLSIESEEQYQLLLQIYDMLEEDGFAQTQIKNELKTILKSFSSEIDIPMESNLNSSYPNPFGDRVNIQFDLSEDSNVVVEIFDLTGRRVTNIIEGDLNAGSHTRELDLQDIPAGSYVLALSLDSQKTFTKIISKLGSAR